MKAFMFIIFLPKNKLEYNFEIQILYSIKMSIYEKLFKFLI